MLSLKSIRLVHVLILAFILLVGYFDLYPKWEQLQYLKMESQQQKERNAMSLKSILKTPSYTSQLAHWNRHLMPNRSLNAWILYFGHELSTQNISLRSDTSLLIILQGSYPTLIQLLTQFSKRWFSLRIKKWSLERLDNDPKLLRLSLELEKGDTR